MTIPAFQAASRPMRTVIEFTPGIAASVGVALIAHLIAPYLIRVVPIPSMVIALLVGLALNQFASQPVMQAGMSFCAQGVLRWAVALLGLRVALVDIAALGFATTALIVVAMAATIVSGLALARWNGQAAGLGAFAGVATGVCGASATLAVATVIPNYPGKQPDIVFVVVAVNALSTFAMLVYPPLCVLLGFDPRSAGVMLGGTIHDVAQVVGAGYAISEAAGNTAVIVKLLRVFLLLPVVLIVGWYFARMGSKQGEIHVPVPFFAIAFLGLCILNSAMPYSPVLMLPYTNVRAVLVEASTWGLLLAIGALGLGTSIKSIIRLGWRHVAILFGTTLVILGVVTAGLLLIG